MHTTLSLFFHGLKYSRPFSFRHCCMHCITCIQNQRCRFFLIVYQLSPNGIKLGQDLKGGTNLRFSLDIDRAIENGRLPPPIKLGGRLYWINADVDEHLRSGATEAA